MMVLDVNYNFFAIAMNDSSDDVYLLFNIFSCNYPNCLVTFIFKINIVDFKNYFYLIIQNLNYLLNKK